MTIQQIVYFQNVARLGSFTKAARACFVSQTAISRQIGQLEAELNVILLERDTAHVRLTLAGQYFYEHITELMQQLEQLVEQTQGIAREQDAHLMLGIPSIMEQHIAAPLLRRYHELHPEVQIVAESGSRQELLRQLIDQKIDLLVALDFDLPSLDGLDVQVLREDRATWLLPRGNPLSSCEKISPKELKGETLILTKENPQSNSEEQLRQYYGQLGLRTNPSIHTKSLHELFMLASAGVGIGLVPSASRVWLLPDLCSIPVDGPQWEFSFLLISRKERSRASVRAMFELAESSRNAPGE